MSPRVCSSIRLDLSHRLLGLICSWGCKATRPRMCPHPTLSTQEVCRNPRVTLGLLSDPLGPPRALAGITYQIFTEGLLDARPCSRPKVTSTKCSWSVFSAGRGGQNP